MAIDANIVNFGQSTPTANALSNFGSSVAGAITANKQSGMADNRRQAAGFLAQAFDDSSDEATTRALIEQARELDPEFTLATIQKVQGGRRMAGQAGQTASISDFEYYEQLKKTDPKAAEAFGIRANFSRPSKQEESDIGVSASERKEIDKLTVKRKQTFVDNGIEAADGVKLIKRTIQLLDTVDTGGYDNAALRAKKLFGVESGDEAELSANLGKSILAQLRPLFGAAFTAAEGDKLDRIEAGFGKSTAGNKRLLKQTLSIADRAARRGLAAAENLGDDFTAREIKKSLAAIQEAEQSINEETTSETPKTAAPQAALDYLKANPDASGQFQEQYGYLPEGQ
jgi:hypothetical protein